jgi:cytochrome c peroxidase
MKKLITIANTSLYCPSVQCIQDGSFTPLYQDRSALSGIVNQPAITGKSPRALVIIGNMAITAGYFDNYLEMFSLAVPGSGDSTRAIGTIALSPEAPKTAERKGESAFYDANLCLQKWQSCHSCHPFMRSDATNWILNRDLSAPKNSKSMMYSWWTPPTSWAGTRLNAWESIRTAMQRDLFLQLDPDQAVAVTLDTFFMRLKPVPSPYLVRGQLSASAMRGKDIFNSSKAGCATCHPAPLYTDMKFHNIGVMDKYDPNINWDTPSIIEAWRTAPYDHLGSAQTVRERIENRGHSVASQKLSQDEIGDLVNFVLSL